MGCPHQATQHLHRPHHGTLTQCTRENALWQSCFDCRSGCRDLFGAPGWLHSPLSSSRLWGSKWVEMAGSSSVLKQHEIQGRQQQVLPVGGILCMADFACLQLQGWAPCSRAGTASSPSLISILGQIVHSHREAKEKQERSISQGIFRALVPLNFSEQRVLCC